VKSDDGLYLGQWFADDCQSYPEGQGVAILDNGNAIYEG